jgi:ankyrin repeat protein
MKQTCLMDASRLNRPAITKALLAKGANPNLVETLEGSTALHMAMYKDGQMEVCKLLVENGVEINV